jgi:hypothetical protein
MSKAAVSVYVWRCTGSPARLNDTPAATRVPSLIGLLNGPKNTSGAMNTVSAGLFVAPGGSAAVPPRYVVLLISTCAAYHPSRSRPLPCDEGSPVVGPENVRSVPANRSTRRGPLPRAVAAVAHWVLALAVIFGVVHSGGRYFYCEAHGLLPSDPCAEAARGDRGTCPSGTLSEHHADCCEIVTLAAMPQAAQAAGPGVAPAARVALLPALWFADRIDLAARARTDRFFAMWRPPPKASADVCARLMVFQI